MLAVFPDVPAETIALDLGRTKDVNTTIENILAGNLKPAPKKVCC